MRPTRTSTLRKSSNVILALASIGPMVWLRSQTTGHRDPRLGTRSELVRLRCVAAIERALEQAHATLERIGLLLLSDPALPSLVGLIVGEPLRTSWWGHPRANVIYHAMTALEEDPIVL